MTLQTIICGFHRSGTSMSAQALSRAGLYLGDSLIQAAPSNPDGHFEDVETVWLHEKWLAQNQTDWCHVGRLPTIDPIIARSDLSPIISRFDKNNRHWGIKDPRATLFLSSWQSVLQNPVFVMVYRHYASCFSSLRRRQADELLLNPSTEENAIRFWRHAETALRSWLTHNESLLNHYEKHPDTCVVLSQESQICGANLIQYVNHKFDLSLDLDIDTGIDINKAAKQKFIKVPDVGSELQVKLEATWQRLQEVAAEPAQQYVQVEWQEANSVREFELTNSLRKCWDQMGLPEMPDVGVPQAGDIENAVESAIAPDDGNLDESLRVNVETLVHDTDITQRSCVQEVLSQLSPIEQTEFLQLAQKKLPMDGYINGLLGKHYLQLQQWNKADACFAIAESDDDPSVWFHIGLLRRQQKRTNEAINAFDRALSLRSNPDHFVVLVQTCMDDNEQEKAIQYCNRAMHEYPDDFRIFSLFADLLCLQNRLDAAFQVCLDHVRNDLNTLPLLQGFQILTRMGRIGEARSLYDESVMRKIKKQTDYRKRAIAVLAHLPDQQAVNLGSYWEEQLAKMLSARKQISSDGNIPQGMVK